jgi:hypothetical protein
MVSSSVPSRFPLRVTTLATTDQSTRPMEGGASPKGLFYWVLRRITCVKVVYRKRSFSVQRSWLRYNLLFTELELPRRAVFGTSRVAEFSEVGSPGALVVNLSVGHGGTFQRIRLPLQLLVGDSLDPRQVRTAQVGTTQIGTVHFRTD